MSSYSSASDTTVTTKERKTYQEKPITCSYAECQHRFDKLQDMINHKISDPSHFYCKKCKFDGDDWEDLLAHQVKEMAPFLGEKKKSDGARPKHIVCELCGQEFKSMDGRKTHRRQAHPADQDVECPGCKCKFPRASHMIDHLEQGRCDRITRRDFFAHMQHKYMLAQIMKAPNLFTDAVRDNQQILLPAMDHLSIKSSEQEEGGVSLLEEFDEAQQSGYKPLEPERSLMDFPSQPSGDAWPQLTSGAPSEVMSTATSKAYSQTSTPSAWAAGSVSKALSKVPSPSEAASTSASNVGSKAATPSAWVAGNASKALFKVAPPNQPAAGQWEAITKHYREQDESTNLFRSHFWNSEKIYWNEFLRCYVCPFPACQADTQPFDTFEDIKQHIELAHLRTLYRCNICFKRYNTCAALVGHVEATSKCGVRESSGFKKFINEITGGFLKAERVAEPKIYSADKSVVVHGQKPLNGITSTRYSGKAPYEE